jgi:hypothetical protein
MVIKIIINRVNKSIEESLDINKLLDNSEFDQSLENLFARRLVDIGSNIGVNNSYLKNKIIFNDFYSILNKIVGYILYYKLYISLFIIIILCIFCNK